MTDEEIIAIRDDMLPAQGAGFDCIAFARAVLAAQPHSEFERLAREYARECLRARSETRLDDLLRNMLRVYAQDNAQRALSKSEHKRRAAMGDDKSAELMRRLERKLEDLDG